MSDDTYEYGDVKNIHHIEFTLFSNNEVKEYSALDKNSMGINSADLYNNLEPKRGGLIDSRLGTTDTHIDCSTCGLNSTMCPGHFGHIELPEYVFHLGFLPFIKKILSCICLRCSKIHFNNTFLTKIIACNSKNTNEYKIKLINRIMFLKCFVRGGFNTVN